MKKVNVLVLLPVNEQQRSRLQAAAPRADFEYASYTGVTPAQARQAEVIIGNIRPALLAEASALKWLQLNSAGADPYFRAEVLDPSVQLTNATGAYGLTVSEYMLASLMSLYRKLHLYRDNQTARIWRAEGAVRSIEGSTILVVGLGDIGGDFARKVKALGAATIGVRRTKGEKPEYLDELYLSEELDTLLPRADVVAISVPGTPQTRHMFDARRLGLMKRDAVLINVGRGSVVDTDALCGALDTGRLLGACIDVTDPEPLPADHRLWGYSNVILTPHIAGNFFLDATVDRIVEIAAQNLESYLAGRPLRNNVSRATGYRI